MTVSYNLDVATSSPLAFLKVCLRWRGSVWKNCWREYLIWSVAYVIIYNIIQHEHVSPELQKMFTNLIHHLDDKLVYIPLVLLLGFFVTFVVDRWKRIFSNIGFIDNLAFTVANYITGHDEETVIVRRNILRYVCASQVLLFRDVSLKARKRFPTMESVVQAGFLQDHELELLIKEKNNFEKYATPINWACALVVRMKNAGNIGSDTLVYAIYKEINEFQKQLQTLCNFDYIPVPLAYPQVAFCVVRAYLAICLVARQYVVEDPESPKPTAGIETVAITMMTMLQVFFYLAWVKVAEELLNPLGDDDEDFECNYVIDYNITTSMNIAGEFHSITPEQSKTDTQKAANFEKSGSHGYAGSVSALNVKRRGEKVHMVPHNDYLQQQKNSNSHDGETTGRLGARRLTFPMSFRRRREQPPIEIPTLSKQVKVQAAQPENNHKRIPSGAQEFYDTNSFAETYSYFSNIRPNSLPFPKQKRFSESFEITP